MSIAARTDAIVDEVREIRRGICAAAGGDLDRLAEHLRQVERDYAARAGVFRTVGHDSAAAVQAAWGDFAGPPRDEIVDGVRDVRRRLVDNSNTKG